MPLDAAPINPGNEGRPRNGAKRRWLLLSREDYEGAVMVGILEPQKEQKRRIR
jgi:hypothetical protein